MKNKIFLLITFFLLASTYSFAQRNKKPPSGTFIAEAQFQNFIPVSPMEFEQTVILYNQDTDSFDTFSIKELSANKSRVLQFLPNETVYATVQKNDASTGVKYGPASITAEKGSYTVTLDYAKFSTSKIMQNNSCSGFAKVGIGMRITAQITTLKAGVDVSSLFGLGFAAETGKLKGQISMDIIGMESSKITDLISMPVDISEASIQAALQSMAAIKGKIYEEDTRLYPQVIAVKRVKDGCSVFDILDKIDVSDSNVIKTN